jgi:hypothetical protein
MLPSQTKEANVMLLKLNRFLTTAEVQEKYGIPDALAPKILPDLPYVHEGPDGTRIHLESEVDEYLPENARRQRQTDARQSPAPKRKQGRKVETREIAVYANELRKEDKTWKEVLSACKKRWPNDPRVKNADQIRATWNRFFNPKKKGPN